MTDIHQPTWHLHSVRPLERDGWAGVSASVVLDQHETELWFAVPDAQAPMVRVSADPFIAAMLVPALFRGAAIRSDHPVSAALLRRVKRVEGLLLGWLPDRTAPISVSADPASGEAAQGPFRAVSFFAGGVDSFDTVIRNLASPAIGNPPLTHAVYLPEFDGPARRSAPRIADTIRTLGLEPIVASTNLRQVFPVDWEWHRGTALAAFAQVLAGGFRVAFIPSSQSYAVEQASGSFPILDESCTTESLRISHDGADAHRAAKIQRSIATHPVALASLHSCTSGRPDHHNCGTCHKCRETMLGLAAAGALESSGTFPKSLPASFFQGWKGITAAPLEDALSVALATGKAPELVPQLERLILKVRHRTALRRLIEVVVLRKGLRPPGWNRRSGTPWQS